MAMKLIRTQAGDGIFVNLIKDDRFKHNRIAVNFILPLARETATGYALLPFLMQRGYAGCSDFTAFARKLDELYGATVAGKVSKAGNYQIITLTITHVDDRYTLNGEPLAEECARLLAEIVTMPAIENGRFDPEAVATEKNSLADTIAAEVNDKRSYAVTRCTELLFEGEPLAVKQYGYAEDVDAITPESAAACYEAMLSTAAVEITMIGPSAGEAVTGIFREAFQKALENRNRQPIDPDFEMEQKIPTEVRRVTEEMDLTQGKMVMGFSLLPAEDKKAQAVSRIATAIYGSSPFSKLFMNVREKLSLCYYCSSSYDRHKGIVMVQSGVEQKNIEKAREEILRQLQAVQEGDFSAEDLDAAKMSVANSFRTMSDYLGGLEAWYLSQAFEKTVLTPEQSAEAVGGVTKEQVVKVAQTVSLDTVYQLTGKEEA